MTTTAVVVDADGHFGDSTRVWFAGSLDAARRFSKRNRATQILAGCSHGKGDTITRGVLQTMTAAGLWTVVR